MNSIPPNRSDISSPCIEGTFDAYEGRRYVAAWAGHRCA